MSRKKRTTNKEDEVLLDSSKETEEMMVDNIEDIAVNADIVEDTTTNENIISCKVIKTISKNKVIINFNGFGLIVNITESANSVNVKYTGNIGTPDFKYEVV